MERRHWIGVGVVVALVVSLLGAAVPSSAQKGKAGAAFVGYVDLAQVTEQIKKTPEWSVMVKQFEDKKTKFRNELEALNAIRYLTPAERQELLNLRAKQKPTEAENARISELEAKSAKVEQEFLSLSMLEKPDEKQSERLKALSKLREEAVNDLQVETDKRAMLLQEEEARLLKEMQDKVLGAIQQVAERQGLALVLDRQLVLYGGQDITQDVIKRLVPGAK